MALAMCAGAHGGEGVEVETSECDGGGTTVHERVALTRGSGLVHTDRRRSAECKGSCEAERELRPGELRAWLREVDNEHECAERGGHGDQRHPRDD